MRLQTRVSFHGIPPSEWLEADIRKRAEKLGSCCSDIVSCRVVVDIPHRHHETGNRFSLRVELTVPGEHIAVTRASNLHAATQELGELRWTKAAEIESDHKHIGLVVRDAFGVARRRLQNYIRRQRRRAIRAKSPRAVATTA
jgi:hypothetical protein